MVLHAENKGLYIGGEWVRPQSGAEEAVLNPATEGVIGMAPVGGPAEIEMALPTARDAFDKGLWPKMSMAERILKPSPYTPFLPGVCGSHPYGGAGKLLSNLPFGGYKRTGIGRMALAGWRNMQNRSLSVST